MRSASVRTCIASERQVAALPPQGLPNVTRTSGLTSPARVTDDGGVHLLEVLREALSIGVPERDIGPASMALRSVLVYGLALFVVRLANKRFMSRATAFDMIVAIMLGSVMSRAITGEAPIAGATAACAALVAMHHVLAIAATRSSRFGVWVKGDHACVVVQDGVVQWDVMRQVALTERDLHEALRSAGHVEDPAQAKLVQLERSGELSVIPKQAPRVVDVKVEPGVQTVRVQLA